MYSLSSRSQENHQEMITGWNHHYPNNQLENDHLIKIIQKKITCPALSAVSMKQLTKPIPTQIKKKVVASNKIQKENIFRQITECKTENDDKFIATQIAQPSHASQNMGGFILSKGSKLTKENQKVELKVPALITKKLNKSESCQFKNHRYELKFYDAHRINEEFIHNHLDFYPSSIPNQFNLPKPKLSLKQSQSKKSKVNLYALKFNQVEEEIHLKTGNSASQINLANTSNRSILKKKKVLKIETTPQSKSYFVRTKQIQKLTEVSPEFNDTCFLKKIEKLRKDKILLSPLKPLHIETDKSTQLK